MFFVNLIKDLFTPSTTVPSLKIKGKIPVQEAKPSESPKIKGKFTRIPKEKEPEPEVVKLKKVPVKPPEPEKQVVTHKAEVTRHQVPELSVCGLHGREDREIVTLGRTEQKFMAEEKTVKSGHLGEMETVQVVQETESKGWTRAVKPQTEDDSEVPGVVKKKITKLPKTDEQKEDVKLKPFEKPEKPEPEQQKIKLKPVPSRPNVDEKEIITYTAEVTKYQDSELTAQKLQDDDRHMEILGKPDRVFTAEQTAHELSHMDEPKPQEPEQDKSKWIKTIKEQKDKEPEPDLSKKKIKKLPKKDEEQEVVTLKPFKKPQKQEAAERKAKDEVQAKPEIEHRPYQRGEGLHRDQPTVAVKSKEDADVALTSPGTTPDVSKAQKETAQLEKTDQIPKAPSAEKPNGEPKVTKQEKRKSPVDTNLPPREEITKDVNKKELQKVEKTPSPRVSKEKVEHQKPTEQLKVELKSTPSPKDDKPKVLKTVRKPSPEDVKETPKAKPPQDATETIALQKVPRKPSVPKVSEHVKVDPGRIPLGKEVSPGAVQMKRVTTQPEEEVFEEEGEKNEEEHEEEAWGWELVPQEDWECQELMGALETPGMPGARRGELETRELSKLTCLESSHPISDDSSNLHHNVFNTYIHFFMDSSLHSPIHSSIYQSFCLFIHQLVHQFISQSFCPCFHVSIKLFLHLSIILSVHVSIKLFLHLSIILYVHASVCPSTNHLICPSIICHLFNVCLSLLLLSH